MILGARERNAELIGDLLIAKTLYHKGSHPGLLFGLFNVCKSFQLLNLRCLSLSFGIVIRSIVRATYMTKDLATIPQLTTTQIELIKATVAKNATDDELKLFLYRAQNLGLDPLKPGQIYFIKYGSSPGVIVIGIDGFRSKAQATGKFAGIARGVVRDDKGKCIGAWCEVSRSDWKVPAKEEVSLVEYNTGKAMWAKMPETMIKKVAEVAALRMAFPDQLGGIYSDDEMDQAEPQDVTPRDAKPEDVAKALNMTTADGEKEKCQFYTNAISNMIAKSGFDKVITDKIVTAVNNAGTDWQELKRIADKLRNMIEQEQK